MEKLEFKNLRINYDENIYSKKKIRKYHIIEIITGISASILFFVLSILYGIKKTEYNPIIEIFITLMILVVSIGGAFYINMKYKKKHLPKNINFFDWMMNFKPNDVEVGWFNTRYLVRLYTANGYMMRNIENFVAHEYNLVDDVADRGKPIFMEITMNDVIDVHLTNVEETDNVEKA